jgi:hypothetical protein
MSANKIKHVKTSTPKKNKEEERRGRYCSIYKLISTTSFPSFSLTRLCWRHIHWHKPWRDEVLRKKEEKKPPIANRKGRKDEMGGGEGGGGHIPK